MKQDAARHGPQARSEDEDVAGQQNHQPERAQASGPRRKHPSVGQPSGDGGLIPDGGPDGPGPDGPDEDEFELIGDDDLGAADLGPAAPNATDPDAASGRVRKVTPGSLSSYLRRVIPVTSQARPRALQYSATRTRTRACCSPALLVLASSAAARTS